MSQMSTENSTLCTIKVTAPAKRGFRQPGHFMHWIFPNKIAWTRPKMAIASSAGPKSTLPERTTSGRHSRGKRSFTPRRTPKTLCRKLLLFTTSKKLLVFEQHFFFVNGKIRSRRLTRLKAFEQQQQHRVTPFWQLPWGVCSTTLVLVDLFTTHTTKSPRKRVEISRWEKSLEKAGFEVCEQICKIISLLWPKLHGLKPPTEWISSFSHGNLGTNTPVPSTSLCVSRNWQLL